MHTKQICVDTNAAINLRQIIKMTEQIHKTKKQQKHTQQKITWSEAVQSTMHLYELE